MQKEQLIKEILELTNEFLAENEAKYIRSLIKKDKLNTLRCYLEDCVRSSERKLLDSVMRKSIDPVYTERYRIVKTLDNKVTYIIQELS